MTATILDDAPLADTPLSWRAAALTTLVAGVAIGLAASRSARSRLLASAAPALVAAYVGPLMAASRRPPIEVGARPRDPDAPPLTISVVVAARDEVGVIERLVRDVAEQDHRAADGRPMFELILVDDRSVDGTGQAALRAAAEAGIGDVVRFVVRGGGSDVPDGKSAALTAAPPEICHGDIVVVLDADARVGPSFLRRLAGYVAAGAGAVTARRRIRHADASELAGAQADEQTVDGLIQRGRWALGGCSEFRGNGITVRRDLLADVGGWRAQALTEDLDLSSRLAAARGMNVAWAIDAEVWEEPVESVAGLWRQRLRWAEGAIRRALEHGPAVVSSSVLSPLARLDFATYVGQLAIPPVILGAAVGAVLGGAKALLILLGAYGASAGILAWDALRWEAGMDGEPLPAVERLRRSIRVVLFGGIWLASVPAALWRRATRQGAVRYDKMAHGVGRDASRASAEPRSAAVH
jgi:glycosyltransferase involved in cell wall biosynthesis